MAKKPTKRKAFNFLRSYYDVLNELGNDKDKLNFLLAILNKQFTDEDPNGLNFIVNICYESQRHSIEQSVRGYKQKMKTDLLGNSIDGAIIEPIEGGSQGGTQGGSQAPSVQEKEKEKEEEQQIDSSKLLSLFNSILGKQARVIPTKAKSQLKQRLKEGYTKEDIIKAITNASKDPHHIESNYKYITLEFITRPDKLERFVNMGDYKIKTQIL